MVLSGMGAVPMMEENVGFMKDFKPLSEAEFAAVEKVCELLIAVEPTQKDGVMTGVLNRLRKACVSVDIQH